MDNELKKNMIIEIEYAVRCWQKEVAPKTLWERALNRTLKENPEYSSLAEQFIKTGCTDTEIGRRIENKIRELSSKFKEDNPEPRGLQKTVAHPELEHYLRSLENHVYKALKDRSTEELQVCGEKKIRRQGIKGTIVKETKHPREIVEYFLTICDVDNRRHRALLLNPKLSLESIDLYKPALLIQYIHDAMRVETESKFELEDYHLVTEFTEQQFHDVQRILRIVTGISKSKKGDWFDWMTAWHFWSLRYRRKETFVDFTKTLSRLYDSNKINYTQFCGVLRYVCDVHSVSQLSSLNIEMIRHLRTNSVTFESLISNFDVNV